MAQDRSKNLKTDRRHLNNATSGQIEGDYIGLSYRFSRTRSVSLPPSLAMSSSRGRQITNSKTEISRQWASPYKEQWIYDESVCHHWSGKKWRRRKAMNIPAMPQHACLHGDVVGKHGRPLSCRSPHGRIIIPLFSLGVVLVRIIHASNMFPIVISQPAGAYINPCIWSVSDSIFSTGPSACVRRLLGSWRNCNQHKKWMRP